ncbi:MAG: Bcr/CflA family efflux MFS transporter [Ilumatobacteraceae bacterium]|nr:Bcr/CflA family efflux MFS transporter [Ilumatobacteraceae bacterium]
MTDSSTPQGARVKGVASGREFIAIVTALMASGALAIDLMLPAFPDMRREFGMSSDSTQVGWIVTAFFLGMAVGPWLYGPASDRYGRRKLLFGGMALYVASALIACVAPSWEWVIVSRFVWGLGAAAPRTLSLAMIRDRYEGNAMARLMSNIMAVFLLVPILAPGIGAGLIAIAPWRIVFWFPAVIASVLMLWATRLPETLAPERRRALTRSALAQALKEVVGNRQTVCFTLAIAFLFGVMTSYLASSEVILSDVYGYGSWFPLFFGSVAIMLALNSLNNARLVHNIGITQLVRRMVMVAMCTSFVFLLISRLNHGHPNFWLYAIGIACVIPVAQGLVPVCNTAAMIPLPHVAGTASAIISTVTTAGGALLGNIGSSSFNGTIQPLAIALTVYIFIAAILILLGATSSKTENYF